VAGAAALMLYTSMNSVLNGVRLTGQGFEFLYYELIGGLIAHGVLMLGEVFMPEENVEKLRAARLIIKGIFMKVFWGGAVLAGTLLPLVALATGWAENGQIAALISLLALAGLFVWEHVWVQAGQAVPLS
jgi:hypothetical protein